MLDANTKEMSICSVVNLQHINFETYNIRVQHAGLGGMLAACLMLDLSLSQSL